jgi:hypothetical protein
MIKKPDGTKRISVPRNGKIAYVISDALLAPILILDHPSQTTTDSGTGTVHSLTAVNYRSGQKKQLARVEAFHRGPVFLSGPFALAVSPDGHYVAFIEPTGLSVYEVSPQLSSR